MLHEVLDCALDRANPRLAVVWRATHEFVHLGRLALADEIDALRVLRVAFLAHQQFGERDHARFVVWREEGELAVVVDEEEDDVSEDHRCYFCRGKSYKVSVSE